MTFKLSANDFELLAKYIEKNAKGIDLTLTYQQNQHLEVKFSNLSQEPTVITFYPQNSDGSSSFAKIATTKRLGDEVK